MREGFNPSGASKSKTSLYLPYTFYFNPGMLKLKWSVIYEPNKRQLSRNPGIFFENAK